MNKHSCGSTFDYVLSLEGVELTEFVGWTTLCNLRDFSGALIASIDSAWIDPAVPVALALMKLDTSTWRPGVATLNVKFTSPNGYVRTLKEPVNWELVKDDFR
jgi:hypothetical protein